MMHGHLESQWHILVEDIYKRITFLIRENILFNAKTQKVLTAFHFVQLSEINKFIFAMAYT